MISQYFIGGIMPESANPVQPSVTVIEIRLFKGGWQCFEGPSVQPYWTGDTAKFGRGEIRVLNADGSIKDVDPVRREQPKL
jgi:hypothetical protein